LDDNTTRADLAVYSITALITGAVWAVAAFFIALGISYAYPGVTPWIPAVTIGSAALLITWSYFLSVHIIPNLKQPERKPAQPAVTRIEHVSADKKQLKYEDCPATMDQIYTVAVRVIAVDAGISNGEQEDVFADRQAYSAFRNWLIKRGYCKWRGSTPQAGVEITEAGYEWFSRWYAPPFPTTQVYRVEDVSERHTQEHTKEE
jgi:hypothetical protein